MENLLQILLVILCLEESLKIFCNQYLRRNNQAVNKVHQLELHNEVSV